MHDCIGDFYITNGIENPVSLFEKYQLKAVSPIYEVLRVEKGIPLFIEDHLDRLEMSFKICNIKCPLSRNNITSIIQRLLEINNCQDGPVKMIFGDASYMFHLMKPYIPAPWEYVAGVKTIFFAAERQNPNAKVWNQPLREKIIKAMHEKGAFESILVDQNGYLTEGSRSNLFLVKNDFVVTTPLEFVLPGITRQKVLTVCDQLGIKVVERMVHRSEIANYDAIFLTGTTRKVLPVRSVDDISFSAENEIMKSISVKFEQLVAEYIKQAQQLKSSTL